MNDEAARQGRPAPHSESPSRPTVPPAVVILLPLEGEPVAIVDALTDSEAARLDDWLRRRSYHSAIRELVPSWPVGTAVAA
jgi:hypothetical protein